VDASGGRNLYSAVMNDPRTGRPPGVGELKLLPMIEDAAVAD
jgi:hypothetical protein